MFNTMSQIDLLLVGIDLAVEEALIAEEGKAPLRFSLKKDVTTIMYTDLSK